MLVDGSQDEICGSLTSDNFLSKCACFGSTYTKIGTIQRRLAWPLRKDDTQNREAFHIFVSAVPFILYFFLTFVRFIHKLLSYELFLWSEFIKYRVAVPSVRWDAGSSPGQENK